MYRQADTRLSRSRGVLVHRCELRAETRSRSPPPALRAPMREIIHVKGDLYRARNGNWYTAFLVTPAGIVLGDPINVGFR